MNKPLRSPYTVKKFLSFENENIEYGDLIEITLTNDETVRGKLLNATSKSITVQIDDYEYGVTGITYSCNFVMLSNVKEINHVSTVHEEINWDYYKDALNGERY